MLPIMGLRFLQLTVHVRFVASRGHAEAVERCLEKGRPAPTVKTLQHFLVYLLRRDNRLGRPPTIVSINSELKHFATAFREETGTEIDTATRGILSNVSS